MSATPCKECGWPVDSYCKTCDANLIELRDEVAALPRVVEALPKCDRAGCSRTATNECVCGCDTRWCEEHADAPNDVVRPLPYRAALLALRNGGSND